MFLGLTGTSAPPVLLGPEEGGGVLKDVVTGLSIRSDIIRMLF